MKIRLGVIGPVDSISLVKKASDGFDKIEIIPFPYEKVEQTSEIILKNRQMVDQWFFSGQAPYYYALSNNLIHEGEGSYVPINGNSLYKTLLEAQLKMQTVFKSFSLDTIQESEIEIFRDSILPVKIFTLPYKGYVPAQDLIDFHLNLYENGEIDVAITCIKAVYVRLKELGVPCFRVAPGIPTIRLMLQFLKERGESYWYKKAQTAILGIEVFRSPLSDEEAYSYKMKHRELELNRLLLDYAELIKGSLIQIGDGHFYIFSTRGEVELHLTDHTLFKLIDDARLHSKLQLRIGLGYGLTALEAEQNVRLAFQHARRHETPIIILVDEDKQVTENLGTSPGISYNGRLVGEDWEKRLKGATISPAIVSKIHSLSRYYKKTNITSQELSGWLKGTERNSRRILAEMERLGLVKVSGEEQSGNRGRPKKIYQLMLDKEAALHP